MKTNQTPEGKTAAKVRQDLIEKHSKRTESNDGITVFFDYHSAMEEYSRQSNRELLEKAKSDAECYAVMCDLNTLKDTQIKELLEALAHKCEKIERLEKRIANRDTMYNGSKDSNDQAFKSSIKLLEALENSKSVIENLIAGKRIVNLDEAIACYDSLIQKHKQA